MIQPKTVAEEVRGDLRAQIAALPQPLRLQGILTQDEGPSAVYAAYTRQACDAVGVEFDAVAVDRLHVEEAILRANRDPRIHGIMVYYPVFGTGQDGYLRDVVSPTKDIEGLHTSWRRRLFDNVRFIDAAQTKKAILPCTPLAVLKLVEAAGWMEGTGLPLRGKRVCIFNRSEIVGRPLAVMMANDGADVVSFDIDGPLRFCPDEKGGHRIEEIEIDRQAALARADIAITGVPSRAFARVTAAELKKGALCLNFSTIANFAPDVRAGDFTFVPRVGPMTVTMAIRNALRLYHHERG